MQKELLLDIAKKAIVSHFSKESIDKDALLAQESALAKDGAVFVTLKQDGKLRGCIGSLVAHQSLLDDLIHNARSAAFHDPRFAPLSEEELAKTTIEISLLSKPQELHYSDVADLKSKIRPNIDGVILTLGNHRATFLPQVWEELPSFENFFAHLCQKAGINPDGCLEAHPSIHTYQVEKI